MCADGLCPIPWPEVNDRKATTKNAKTSKDTAFVNSARADRQILGEVTGQQMKQMSRCASSLGDAVSTIRICHEIEGLTELNQPIYEELAPLIVHVVVT